MRVPGIWFDNHLFKNVVFCKLMAQNDTVKLMLSRLAAASVAVVMQVGEENKSE